MTKEDIIRKLTSRKFILTIAMYVFAILCLTGVIPVQTQESWKWIILIGASIIAYVVSEGVTDIFGIIAKNKQEADTIYELEEGEEE